MVTWGWLGASLAIVRSSIGASRLDVLSKIAVFVLSLPIAYLFDPGWAMTAWASLLIIAPLTGRWSEKVADRARAVA